MSLSLPFISSSQTCAVVLLRKPGRRQCCNHESLGLRHFSRAVAVRTMCGRCSVINPSAAVACNALSGCDIFQRQSRNELASVPMANQGRGRGHTLAPLLMGFPIKLEPPRCRIATLRGKCGSKGSGVDRQLTGFPTLLHLTTTRQNVPQNSFYCLKICRKADTKDLARTLTGFYIFFPLNISQEVNYPN